MSYLPINQIICGDCIKIMQSFPKNCIDFILTDLPYGLNKNEIQGDNSLWAYDKPIKLCFEILKENSHICIYSSIELLNKTIPLIESSGLKYKWLLICYISNGMVRGKLGFSNYIALPVFEKGKAKYHKQLRDVCVISTSSKKRKANPHPYFKDLDFEKKVIEALTLPNDIVLDCFTGSGTTCLASKQLNRRYIGIEINKEYCDFALNRLR